MNTSPRFGPVSSVTNSRSRAFCAGWTKPRTAPVMLCAMRSGAAAVDGCSSAEGVPSGGTAPAEA
eukprot:5841947-Prymnesium_polylepis.1